MRNWRSVDEESRLLDEVATRRQRLQATRRAVTPEMGALASQYSDAYAWMPPPMVQAFAQSGIPADSPQAVSAADLAAKQAAEDGRFDTTAEDVPDAWYETLFNAATDWAKPVIRTGFLALSMPFEEIQGLLSSAGTALLDRTQSGSAGLVGDKTDDGGFEIDLLSNIAAVVGEFANPDDLLRDFWTNYTTKAAESGGSIALGDLLSGRAVDLGTGFLPGGDVYRRREEQKYRLQLDGQFVTPGRLLARNFVEPGQDQYQFLSGANDFAQNIFADPAAGELNAIARSNRALRTFQQVGGIPGIRKTVDAPTAINHFLTHRQGQGMVRWFTQNQDVEDAWRITGNLNLAEELVASTDEAQTFDILRRNLGTVMDRPTTTFIKRNLTGPVAGAVTGVGRTLTGKGGLGESVQYGHLFGGGAQVRRSLANVRLGLEMPGQILNVHDINDSARQLDSWMRNARFSDDFRKARITELAGLSDGDGIGLWNVTRRIMDDTEGVLVQGGMRESRAKKLTQMYETLNDENFVGGFDSLGRHQDVSAPFKVQMGDTLVEAPRGEPLLASEFATDVIPLPPTAREIRRATSQVIKWADNPLWKGSIDGIDSVMSNVWKPLQLLRGAYTFRVIAEEQMRMAGAGYDSMLNHPIKAIAWALSVDSQSRLGRRMASLIDQKGTTTVTGELWDEVADHAAAMSRGSAGWRGLPGEVATGRFVKARHGDDPDFYRGWTVELSHMSNDPVMRRLAGGLKDGELRSIGGTRGDVVEDVKDWFWNASGGRKFRNEWARIEGRSQLATDRRVADEYIDLFVERLQNSTGGNTDLLAAVASGNLGGNTLRGFGGEGRIAKLLEDVYDEAAPNFVKKPEVIRSRTQTSQWNKVVEMGFDNLMSKPTNWLSRSPVFKQKYWQRVEELVGHADATTQRAMIEAAEKAGVDTLGMRRLSAQGQGDQLTSLEDVDGLSRGFALSETKGLLYDMNKRGQFFDMARIIFPFGEAWKEIITAWTGILRKNPSTIRRFQQGLEGVRQASMFGEAETTQGSGEGFFHTDPNTGEEVFTFPLLGSLASGMLGLGTEGAGVEFVGQASGLNIVSATVLPGFGPAVQLPASHLIPNTPNWDVVRDTLLPFGENDSIIDSFLPAWMEKAREVFSNPDPEQNRLFANTVSDTMRALAATGSYDMSTVEGQQNLVEDATWKSKALYAVRAIAQFTAPTGPSFQWDTKDVEGNLVPVKLLSDEMRRLTEEYGGDRMAAYQEWVKRFGVNNVLSIIGKSTALVERPVTEEGDSWLRAHAAQEEDYAQTIGLFAPEPPVGEFDYTAYLRQFETGAREGVSPAEQLALANDFLGRVQFEQAKVLANMRPGPESSMFLTAVRQQLAEQYPGFDGWVSRSIWEKKPKPDEMIAELRSAVNDPELANTDAGQGIRKYLSAVDMANQMVLQLPGNTRHYQQAKSAAPIRMWLRLVARQIIEENPDFTRAWSMVFERELADDDLPAAA